MDVLNFMDLSFPTLLLRHFNSTQKFTVTWSARADPMTLLLVLPHRNWCRVYVVYFILRQACRLSGQ